MKINFYIFILLLVYNISDSFIINNPHFRLQNKLKLKKDFFNDFPIKKNNTNIIKYNNNFLKNKNDDDYNNKIIDKYYIKIFLYSIFTYYCLIYYFSNGIISF
jgi:hypothetical protein